MANLSSSTATSSSTDMESSSGIAPNNGVVAWSFDAILDVQRGHDDLRHVVHCLLHWRSSPPAGLDDYLCRGAAFVHWTRRRDSAVVGVMQQIVHPNASNAIPGKIRLVHYILRIQSAS